MGDGHRAAARDLAPEDRHDGAGRAEDVSEANRHEPRRDLGLVAPGLDDPFGERLRLSHHGLRVRGLVGRDEHEPLRPELDRHVGDDARAERVVAHRLDRVRLHQRDVLVRRRVEHDTRAVLVEDLAHLDDVLDVTHHGCRCSEPTVADELALDLEERRLGVVHEHELRGLEARDLAAQLGPDRASGARDEDDLVLEVVRDRGDVDVDRLAAEHVLDLDGTKLPREVAVARHEVGKAGKGLDRDVEQASGLDDAGAELAGGGRDRDQDLVGPSVAHDVVELGDGAEYAHAVEAQVALARVVVEEPDRRVAERRAALHLLHDELCRISRTDDDHVLAAGHDPARERTLDQRPGEQPGAGDEGEAEQQVDEPDSARHRDAVHVEEGEDEEDRDRREGDTTQRAPHVPRRDVAPPAVVEPRQREDGQLQADDEEHDRPVEIPVVVHRARLETEVPGEPPGGRDQRCIDGDLPDRVTGDRAAHPSSPLDGHAHGRADRRDDLLLLGGVDPAPHRQRDVLRRGALGLG